ncbi:MAG: ABC transporter ATP-binding protein/permease, partial [Clostridiales bacterium]|nr:ABC transporter ATP-binding protein/permease [Clostridiales bacterium]
KPVVLPKAIATLVNNAGIGYFKQNLIVSSLIIIGICLINAVFTFIKEISASLASESSIKFLKDKLYDHMQKLPYEYLNNSQTGDLIQRCTSDVETIRKFISIQAVEIVRVIFMVITSIVIMLNINTRLTLLSVVTMPFLIVISYAFYKNVKKTFREVDIKEGELTTTLQENLTAVRVVRAFARENYEMDKFQKNNKEFKALVYKLIKHLAFFWGASDVVCLSQIAIVVFSSILMADRGLITVGTLILFITYVTMLIWPVRQLGRLLSDFGKMQVSLNRVFEVLNEEEEKEADDVVKPDLCGSIIFNNVYFKFDGDNNYLLNNISFEVKPGQTVAILGSTGSGKSTLMHLLLRLYDYSSGSITINGTELKNIEKRYLRKNIGVVLQDPFLFSRTIKENIKMAKYGAFDSEIYDVTQLASVHNVITSFENGYDTVVGEKGVTLSGGQKQRVAIARALIKNSPVVIFDDSLSAVDTETDAQIRRGLKFWGGDKITFLISQRVNTIKNADIILVMENGLITATGNHEQLIAKEGLYKRVWGIQNRLEDELTSEVV